MSEKENANEMDNYGVWVKNAPENIDGESQPSEETSIDDMDLPDFGDFEDAISSESENMPSDDFFNDLNFSSNNDDSDSELSLDDGDTSLSPDELANIAVSEVAEEPSFDEGDTSLNPDELANITMGQDTIQEEAAPEETDFSEPDFSIPTSDDDMEDAALSNAFFSDDAIDEDPFTEPATENIAEDTDISDSDPDFSIDEPAVDEPAIEENSAGEETQVGTDDFTDGDIDLGSFMSDSSGGGDEFSFEDGDIDLGDFMGDGFGGGSKEPAEIQDEQTLDISVDFDEDAKNIAIEDTPENEATLSNKTAPAADSTAVGDDMFSSFDAAVAAVGIPEPTLSEGQSSGSIASDSDEVDLSEFGFDDDDSNIGMTNGPDSANPVKKEVVNYDMKVTVDGDSKTPPVLDVVNGKISSKDYDYDSEEEENTSNMSMTSQNSASPEISEKGKEILEQIMGELASLKDEIKSIKNEFAEMQNRPVAAAEPKIPAPSESVSDEEDNTGFFGADDGDDTIALSGSEMSNILNSAEFSEESQPEESGSEESTSMGEPQIEENSEPEMEETAISDDELDIEDPTIASVTGDIIQTKGMAENGLPDEISVPKTEGFNNDAIDDYMAEDTSIEDSLTEDKLNYLGESPAMDEPVMEETSSGSPDVSEIMKENISMQDDEAAGIGIGSDIDAAFNEADADESDIMDNSLAEKDNYEDSVSGIMQDNISMQDDEAAGIGIGTDIDAAFNEADAAESDIMDNSLAEKDAYEQKINKSIDGDNEPPMEDPIGDSLDEPALEDPMAQITEPSFEDSLEEPAIEEPPVEDPDPDDAEIEETVVEAPLVEESMSVDFEESEVEEHTTEAASAPTASSMPKDLKKEIVSVLSYMDQLLENLPEDKITEFAKSEHFVTYKKLFDELGLA